MSDDAITLHLQGERQRLGIEPLPDYTLTYEPDHEMIEDASDYGLAIPTKRLRGDHIFGLTERGAREVMALTSWALLLAVTVGIIALVAHWLHGAHGV